MAAAGMQSLEAALERRAAEIVKLRQKLVEEVPAGGSAVWSPNASSSLGGDGQLPAATFAAGEEEDAEDGRFKKSETNESLKSVASSEGALEKVKKKDRSSRTAVAMGACSSTGTDVYGSMGGPSSTGPAFVEDDVYLYRYIESYKGELKKCVSAIRKARAWRNKNADFVRHARRQAALMHANSFPLLPPRLAAYGRIVLKLLPSAPHGETITKQPVVIVRFGISNLRTLCDTVPQRIVRDFMVFSNEWEFWQCDYLTRLTGLVHKCHRFVDLHNISVKTIDRRLFNVISESSKLSDVLHPQMTARTVYFNAPSVLKVAFGAFRKFGFTARAAEKFHVMKKMSSPATSDTVVRQLVTPETLPSFLGGLCSCEGGCVPGCPNEWKSLEAVDSALLKEYVQDLEKHFEKNGMDQEFKIDEIRYGSIIADPSSGGKQQQKRPETMRNGDGEGDVESSGVPLTSTAATSGSPEAEEGLPDDLLLDDEDGGEFPDGADDEDEDVVSGIGPTSYEASSIVGSFIEDARSFEEDFLDALEENGCTSAKDLKPNAKVVGDVDGAVAQKENNSSSASHQLLDED